MNEKYYELMKKDIIRRAKRRIRFIRLAFSVLTIAMMLIWVISVVSVSVTSLDNESWLPVIGFVISGIYLFFFAVLLGGTDDEDE